MKKFLIGLLLVFAGCQPHIVRETEQQYFDRVNREMAEHISKFEYENHKYLYFTYDFGYANQFGNILHDPNCPCLTGKVENVD